MSSLYKYYEYISNTNKEIATRCLIFQQNKVGSESCKRCPLNEEFNMVEKYVKCRGSK
jgi:hypothetical protein